MLDWRRVASLGSGRFRARRSPLRLENLEPRLAFVRWYVDAAASGANTGVDWANAMVSLQETLLLAFPDDEIWVARGTYRPTDSDDRTISFELLDGMKVYGGFAGFETELEERNIIANPTILSGDLVEPGDTGDNSFHVVRIRSEAVEGEINGFTITGGNANGDFGDYNQGGGIFNHGMFSIVDCTIIANSAQEGGGIYTSSHGLEIVRGQISSNFAAGTGGGGGISADGSLYGPGNVALTDTILTGNVAASGNGGGIASRGRAELIRVTMIENSAIEERGGGVFNASDSGMRITDSNFLDNIAVEDDGGGVYNARVMEISGSAFMGNVAGGRGGAISNSGSLIVRNSTIDHNSARHGGGIHNFNTIDTLVVGESTLSRNNATELGGGLYNELGGITFTNGTISTNTAASGGGVYSIGQSMLFDHATIVLNTSTASLAGGIAASTPGVSLLHSLIATNTRSTDDDPAADDISGDFSQISKFNLIGAADNATGIAHGVQNNQVGSSAAPIAPLLGPLANNGGTAETHLPLAGSPAIDAGDPMFTPGEGNPPVETDQRGLERIVDGDGNAVPRIDIGSVEAPEGSGSSLPCDMNNDGRVGLRDLILLRNNLGLSGEFLTRRHGDFDGNFVVNQADVAMFISNYGATTQAPSPAAVVVEEGSGVRGQGSGVAALNLERRRPVARLAASRLVGSTPTAAAVDRVMSHASVDSPRPSTLRASRGRPARAVQTRLAE